MTVEPIWRLELPSNWAGVPEAFSYSTLRELEECPRQWALRHSDYPAIWKGSGYPSVPNVTALTGSVVHSIVERAIAATTAAGCRSLSDARAIEAFRAIGGFSGLLERGIQEGTSKLGSNPRAAGLSSVIIEDLRRRAPRMREVAQLILLQTESRRDGEKRTRTETQFSTSMAVRREVSLSVARLGWRGRPDLVWISDGGCHIADIKTGAEVESDHEQLKVYAFLWSLDKVANPANVPVTRLTLLYPGKRVNVPTPDEKQLAALERELQERTRSASRKLLETPPAALPAPDQCAYCAVRQLCSPYWIAGAGAFAREGKYTDVQVKVISRRSHSSWSGEIQTGKDAGTCLVRDTTPTGTFSDRLAAPGGNLRLLNVGLTTAGDEDPTIPTVVLSVWSEAFLLEEQGLS